tara:strand:+ start:123 stop:278 length:156 start_codon:yes stop_codon:yes gene_type:complete
MMKNPKELMAELLSQWLFFDYIHLLEGPSKKDIERELEEHEGGDYGSLQKR